MRRKITTARAVSHARTSPDPVAPQGATTSPRDLVERIIAAGLPVLQQPNYTIENFEAAIRPILADWTISDAALGYRLLCAAHDTLNCESPEARCIIDAMCSLRAFVFCGQAADIAGQINRLRFMRWWYDTQGSDFPEGQLEEALDATADALACERVEHRAYTFGDWRSPSAHQKGGAA